MSFARPIGIALMLAAFATVAAPLTARAEMPTFQIVAENGRFTPETVTVPANTRFRVELTNRNAGPEEFETSSPLKELVVAPGSTRSTVFPPLQPGTYPFFGEFHRDTAKGQIVAK